jgi:hypothetical protein
MNDVEKAIDAWPEPQRSIGRSVREIVLAAGDGLKEDIKWGAPTFFGAKNVCSLMCHQDHVNLQLFEGARLEDPEGVLEGTGKGMRHIKLRSESDVHRPVIDSFVRQALKLARG